MNAKSRLAALLLTTALITAPCLSVGAYAHEHDGGDKTAFAGHGQREHLTEAQIKLLRETMHKARENDKKVFEELHKLHDSMHNVLAAQTFDRKAFLSLSEEIEAKRTALAKSRVEAFASIADQFTPEQRLHLERMFAHDRHHHHHHHGKGHDGWKHGEGHEGWFQHHGYDSMTGSENSPTTIGNPSANDGYPPYAPR